MQNLCFKWRFIFYIFLAQLNYYKIYIDNDAKTKKSATDSGMDGLFKKPLNLDEVKQLV